MSIERYYELYKRFLNHTISKEEYEELMEWVSNDKNDRQLRNYMARIWQEEENITVKVTEFKNQLEQSEKRWKNPLRLMTGFSRIAAAFLVLAVASLLVYQYLQPSQLIFQTAYGETLEVALEDGSLVTLNANSKLSWEKKWKTVKSRKVQLDGEAFFDVKHTEDDLPFIVETKDLTINVLGTTFNVRSREEKTNVTLETGKIKLELKRELDREVEMEPGDRVDFSAVRNSLSKEKIEVADTRVDWMVGVLRFEDVSVGEMFLKIEELYGKKLISGDRVLMQRRIFTGVPYEDWSVTKQALELALGVEIEEENNQLTIK